MTTYVLAFYEIDRACGGPEEGGWYFDTGQLVRVFRVFKNEEKALTVAYRVNRLLHHLQRNKRSVDSVIYDGGRHEVVVFEDFAPRFFPETRPQYE